MLEYLLVPLAETVSFFNLLSYITVRSGAALLTAFFLSMMIGPWMIRTFRAAQHGGQTVKDVLPHEGKKGTPTMGGVMVIGTFLFSCLLWADFMNPYMWILLGLFASFGAIGLIDDWLALTKKWRNGLPGKFRLGLEFVVAAMAMMAILHVNQALDATTLQFPFVKEWAVDLGYVGYVAFGAFIITGFANAVNLTDGLDGLVSMPSAIAAAAFAMLAYVVGRVDFSAYLFIPHVAGAGEITVTASALVGSLLGFLWFNAPPARIFMGDTGALPIGAFLGAVAVIIKQEMVLLIIGGLFVLETISVITQVVSFKLTGKRIFRMAPLHHHFEQLGWPESTIVVRFWIISLMLALIGLATLKLR